ncbi:MAG: diguanylate cyclase domain-containing protein [Acidimicrobiales bacterium]
MTDAPTPTPTNHDDERPRRSPEDDRRLADIASALQMFATMRFDARAESTASGDLLDAVAESANFLGHELGVSVRDLERRVSDLTTQVAEMSLAGGVSLRDARTGLASRELFDDRLAHRISVADRRRTHFALLVIAVDDPAALQRLGPGAMDALANHFAAKLRAVVRESDTATRGDPGELVLLLDEVDASESVEGIAERLVDEVRGPLEVNDQRVITSASIGFVLNSDALTSVDAMTTAARAALADARRAGSGQFILYNESRHGASMTP